MLALIINNKIANVEFHILRSSKSVKLVKEKNSWTQK